MAAGGDVRRLDADQAPPQGQAIGVKGRSTMSKKKLVKALRQH